MFSNLNVEAHYFYKPHSTLEILFTQQIFILCKLVS